MTVVTPPIVGHARKLVRPGDVSALDLRGLTGVRRRGITPSSSAPPPVVEELFGCLAGLGPAAVNKIDVADKNTASRYPSR
jgi:hypothetical protein